VVVSDNYGTKVVMEKSSFFDNEVTGLNGQYGQGGAIYMVEDDRAGGSNEDNLEMFDSTFQGNLAGRQGGAVWFTILGHGTISNSTFESNSTTAPFNEVGQGGAMAIGGDVITILNSTFAYNHASYQGGAIHGGGEDNQITLKNTIFLSNTLNFGQTQPSTTEWQGYHTNRTMLDGGQNIQFPRLKPGYNNDVNNLVTNNAIFENPLLANLADNGGPTLTMALMAGSPAINTGANGCPATDQRGEAREGQCDIGAYEHKVSQLEVNPGSQTILPGETATYQIQVLSSSPINQPLMLSAANPYATLMMSLTPATILPGETATLVLTDTHSSGSSLIPGLWHTLTLTAENDELMLMTEVHLLVGGQTIYLPMVSR
jgi:predicted outer membrane repeat protein